MAFQRTESDMARLDSSVRLSLAHLLHPTTDVRELRKRLHLEHMPPPTVIYPGFSPMQSTVSLLSTYERSGGTVSNLRQVLLEMNRRDAVDIIDQALSDSLQPITYSPFMPPTAHSLPGEGAARQQQRSPFATMPHASSSTYGPPGVDPISLSDRSPFATMPSPSSNTTQPMMDNPFTFLPEMSPPVNPYSASQFAQQPSLSGEGAARQQQRSPFPPPGVDPMTYSPFMPLTAHSLPGEGTARQQQSSPFTTTPHASSNTTQPQPITIWTGHVEVVEIGRNSQRQNHQLQCTVSTLKSETIQEIKPDLWPIRMTMTPYPKSVFDSINNLMNLASQHLRTVTFNFMENPQTVTVLKILMAIEVTGKNIAIVNMVGPVPQCPIRTLILVWNHKQKQFTGLIPLNQGRFVAVIKRALLERRAQMQQQIKQQQQQTHMQSTSQPNAATNLDSPNMGQESQGNQPMDVQAGTDVSLLLLSDSSESNVSSPTTPPYSEGLELESRIMDAPFPAMRSFIPTTSGGGTVKSHDGLDKEEEGSAAKKLKLHENQSTSPLLQLNASTNFRGKQPVGAQKNKHPLPDAKALYAEALEKGYVSTGIIKVIVLGHAGSGKTHVKFLILKKRPPVIRRSTSLAENPIRAISQTRVGRVGGGDEEEEWIEVTLEELLQIIADSLRAGVTLEEIEKVVRVETTDTPQEPDTAETEDTKSSSKEDAESLSAPVSPEKELEPPLAGKSTPRSTSTMPSNSEAVTMECHASASIEELEEDMIKLMENSSGSRKLHDFQWVYFIDTGGQPQFCDLLPTFIKGTHMILFVLKLPERLDECPTIEYYSNVGNPCSHPCKSGLRNDQIFQHCIRTMCSTDEESPNAFPMVAVVGTHKDEEHLCTETREEKNSTLLRMCRPVSKKVIYYGQEMKDMIFPVNAKSPQEEDHKVAAQLRRAIIQEAERIEPAKIPIPWYMLEQGIRRLTIKLGRSIVTTSECLAVARRLRLNDSHFNAALEFFHNLNTFLYYPDHLPDVIFSEPQALLDKLSELVQRAYELRDEPTKVAITGEWLDFRDYGYITPRHLGRFSSHYFDAVFTPTKLLHLLEGLLVVAQVSQDTYFMPSLLRTIKHEDVQRSPQTSSTAAPLLIRFPHGCARNGVYPSLIVYLLSHSNPTPWKIAYRSGNPICISGNCIKFQFPDSPCIIQLADSFSYFEVHISGPPEEISPQLCSDVKETIFTGIEKVCTALHYTDSKPKVAFFCSADECCLEAIHPATISRSGFLLLCSENPTEVYPSLGKQHIIWLDRSHSSSTSQPSTLNKKPRLAQLKILRTSEGQKVEIIESIAPNWKELGICLDFDDDGRKLDLIESEQKQNGPIACCQQMFKHWLGGNGKAATWRVLLGLLEDIHQTNLAIRVRIALNSL